MTSGLHTAVTALGILAAVVLFALFLAKRRDEGPPQ
jgi:hypothetical protein